MAYERSTPFIFSEGAAPPQREIHPKEFFEQLKTLPKPEHVAFIRLFVQERNPQGFSNHPFLWEAVREWISRRHGLSPRQIGLAGSAQLGFSTSPSKNWAHFDPKRSDLDIFIVDGKLFEKVAVEARLFITNSASSKTYLDQAETTQTGLRRGYVNLKQIRADWERYKTCANLRNDASIVIDKLRLHGFQLAASDFRIYENWAGLAKWSSIQAESWLKNNLSPS